MAAYNEVDLFDETDIELDAVLRSDETDKDFMEEELIYSAHYQTLSEIDNEAVNNAETVEEVQGPEQRTNTPGRSAESERALEASQVDLPVQQLLRRQEEAVNRLKVSLREKDDESQRTLNDLLLRKWSPQAWTRKERAKKRLMVNAEKIREQKIRQMNEEKKKQQDPEEVTLLNMLMCMRHVDTPKKLLFFCWPKTVDFQEIFQSIEPIWNKSDLAELPTIAEEDGNVS